MGPMRKMFEWSTALWAPQRLPLGSLAGGYVTTGYVTMLVPWMLLSWLVMLMVMPLDSHLSGPHPFYALLSPFLFSSRCSPPVCPYPISPLQHPLPLLSLSPSSPRPPPLPPSPTPLSSSSCGAREVQGRPTWQSPLSPALPHVHPHQPHPSLLRPPNMAGRPQALGPRAPPSPLAPPLAL